MKLFTKIALASSVVLSANAMAMQAMDDESLGATTGQDGLNIGISLDGGQITVDQLFIHDNDGLNGGAANAGAIVIGTGEENKPGIRITQNGEGNLATLVIDTDAGTSPDGAFLNVAAEISGLTAEIGSIGVGASGTQNGVVRGTTGTNNEILTGLTLELGSMSANVQLGATPQGAMIKLDSEITEGLKLTNLGIKDNAGGGSIVLDSIHVVDTGSSNLGLNASISVKPEGLAITPGAQNISAYIGGVHLGSATAKSIGDIEIKGLNMGESTITITGH